MHTAKVPGDIGVTEMLQEDAREYKRDDSLAVFWRYVNLLK
jgi:hypothetical protein